MNSSHRSHTSQSTRNELGFAAPSLADRRRYPPQDVFEAGLRHHHIANTAYPIHHQTTVRPYRVPREEIEDTVRRAWQNVERLGLYVHIPFCAARCHYCEYTVVDRNDQDAQEAYLDALRGEFALYRALLETGNKTLIGFDIGGGTPAFVDPAAIRQIVETARHSFRLQPGMAISIETTPVIADREPAKLAAYKEMGIDRISMGVQSTHLKLAQSLGREYSGPSMLERAVSNVRAAGFQRFNIDLMYGFADQELGMWRRTVEQTIALGPEYITLYQMRYKGTRLAAQANRVSLSQVNAMRAAAAELLHAAGYDGTPGKNTYSRLRGDPGTSDYLTERVIVGTPYLGLGLGAQSLSPYTLSYNAGAAPKTLKPYLRAVEAGQIPIQDLYHLPIDAAMAKMIAVSFYFGQIHREHFWRRFGVRLTEHFAAEVAFVLERDWMEFVGPYLRLTPSGTRHFNGIVALFYAGSVQDYLVHLQTPSALPAPPQRAQKVA